MVSNILDGKVLVLVESIYFNRGQLKLLTILLF